MLYMFLIVGCLYSNYMVASEKPLLDTTQNKECYDKILDERVKDSKQRAKYNDGYLVMSFGIMPISEVYVMMPAGNKGCFISVSYRQAVEIQAALDKHKKSIEDDIKF